MRVELKQSRLPMGGSNATITMSFISHKKLSFNQAVKLATLQLQEMAAETAKKSAARKRRRIRKQQEAGRKK